MKITIPVMGFGRAGGFRVLSKLANHLIGRGHEVSFLAPFDRAIPYYPTNASIDKIRYPFSKVRYLKIIFSFISISCAIARNKADFIFFSEHLLSYACIFNFKKTTKKVYYIQAYEVNLVNGKVFKLIAYLSYFINHFKITNSEHVLPHKFFYNAVIPAGVDTDLFKNIKSDEEKSRSVQTVGIIGRVESWKGTKEVIDIFERLVDEGVLKFKLNIAIHKPLLSNKLKEFCSHYIIQNDDQLAEFYRTNDILLAVGLIEDGAFHYPCAEGMATGLIVISNYSPLTNSNSDFAIKTFDSDTVYEMLKKALTLPRSFVQEEGVKNRYKIESNYSWITIAERLDIVLSAIHTEQLEAKIFR